MKVYQATHRIVERVRDYIAKATHVLHQGTLQSHPLGIDSAAHHVLAGGPGTLTTSAFWKLYVSAITLTTMDSGLVLHARISFQKVTSYHKLSDLKLKKCILSPFWRPEVQNQHHWVEIKEGVGIAAFPLEALGENLFLAFSSF